MSRPVVAALFSSLDGVVSDPYLFQYDSFDEGLGQFMTEAIGRVAAGILGRTTYEQWAGYWPNQAPEEDASFADFIKRLPKYVASRTLTQDDLTWQNSTLIEADLLDFVRQLKQTDGGAVGVQGSISVVRQLAAAGLLDELTLCLHPAVAGEGVRLFADAAPLRLELLDSRITEKGNAILTYGPGLTIG
ncbi:dihydrofolate reductase family protein [Propioniciclava sp. MC1595]|uniref:dihydrofolate reductase family protein n=1 Tax=Propioniciclava sp. MC1595 TaxID=2760308 RepID=UPI00166240B0|nr:dihydrofolate reductase family protein [Propioniciclava sp. MC1595]MBB1495252.1 dihydrofolate reductase family protein [Propioniciclava sp. MC1595]QTE26376.1 dihydrofolate reductase family protein [Propioniciclava sp. MC1595]